MRKSTFAILGGLLLTLAGSAVAQDRSCKSAEPADNEVFLYTEKNFKGKCVGLQKFGTNIANTGALGIHDDTSAIKVGKGVRAMVCEHADFLGKCHSILFNTPDMSQSTGVGNNEVSSLKVLQKRALVEMHFVNQLAKEVFIYEKVGGVDSYLGTMHAKSAHDDGHAIFSDVNTTIVAKVDGKPIGGGFQIKSEGLKVATIAPDAKGVAQLMLKP